MQTTRPSAGLPPRLKLLIVELAGIALMAVGFRALVLGQPLIGLPLVPLGADLLLRPGARRRVPRLDRLLLKLVDRWRTPLAP